MSSLELITKVRRLQSIQAKLQAEQDSAQTQRISLDAPLLDFIPLINPKWERPVHLQPVVDLLERATAGEEVEGCVSVPPQHGKTETILMGAARYLAKHPDRNIAYVSYAADYAHSRSKIARDYAIAAGVKLRADTNSAQEWRTVQGGSFFATGIGGPLTGQPISGLLIIDDPHKNRAEAESKTIRDKVYGWFTSTAYVRVHPGASCIVVHTRWHPDDLIGRLSSDDDHKWSVVNLPAVNDGSDPRRAVGEPLWHRRPLDWLEKRKAKSLYDWWSLYQGQPRPKGAEVFQDAYYYDELPTSGYRIAIGIDLAYSKKTQADYSVAVVMLEYGGYYFIADVVRVQTQAPQFAETLKRLRRQYPARPRWYCAGPEIGVADLIGGIDARAATADKFVRAQPVAAAWNDGKVLLPTEAPWVDAFVGEVCGFTGISDAHDDQVDALAAAFDSLKAHKWTTDWEHQDAAPDYSDAPTRHEDRIDSRNDDGPAWDSMGGGVNYDD